MKDFNDNSDARMAWMFVEHTGRNVFLTGRAGTGKTTFLKYVMEHTGKRVIVTAPTGVAAINAGGMTLHSFFQLSLGPLVPEAIRESDYTHRFNKNKISIIKTLDLLVIDEISMVRADVLDAVDLVLRRFRRHDLPFGGVQLLLIGDMQQLPPVVKDDEHSLLALHYKSPFFFCSKALQQTDMTCIELKKIYRQQDEEFISLLNAVRDNKVDEAVLRKLNSRVDEKAQNDDGTITLCTHNASANKINEEKLRELKGEEFMFEAKIDGVFNESLYPVDKNLVLKEGAQVMFCKNDTVKHEFFNGKVGVVESIDGKEILVRCIEDGELVSVPIMTWDNVKYTLDQNTGKITENKEGSFSQYPLRLAWAITIHKSQGLTFDKVLIEADRAFSHGQVYVALSRCRTLEGIRLLKPIPQSSLITDGEVSEFTEHVENNQPDEKALDRAVGNYKRDVLKRAFDFAYVVAFFDKIRYIHERNAGAIPSQVVAVLEDARARFSDEIFKVSVRFSNVIDSKFANDVNAEKDDEFSQKIKNGAEYFLKKADEIVSPVVVMDLEFDNKAVNESLASYSTELNERFAESRAMMEVCRNDFDAAEVIKAQNKVRLSEVKVQAKKKAVGNELFQLLDEWRERVADENNTIKSAVMNTAKLLELSEKKPSDVKELKKLLSPPKLKKYGAEILSIINKYSGNSTILDLEEINDAASSTYEQTLKLYKKGLTPEEIADEREKSLSTIETHLAKLAKEGLIDPYDFVTTDEVEQVQVFVEKHGTAKLADVYNGLDGKLSYLKLRMALCAIDR